ncbi:MAG TPA: acyl-CoA dehydrogenase family protein [Pseudolabrys sp.]|nr:acyl-CoA dehydrogenase family protein [Pseudolabrys sp.]
MDFTLTPEIEDLRLRVRAFVEEHVLPLEADPENFTDHENIPEARLAKVREKARKAGLWAPQAPKEFGGMALPIVAWAAIYEESARSIFGPLSIHCMAPDDGNMNLLARAGTLAQKERWLRPLVEGKARSAFAMTEPHPGSGSDPGMMITRAEKKGDRYVIHGRKWFITGAEGAAHHILIARTSNDKRRGLTAFLHHKDQPGWRIVRRVPIMGPHEHGGHCELEYDGLEIPEENILLNVGDGLRVTQIRLGPARLTHCMRWLGFAKRCMEIAQEYVGRREAFGARLADRENVQVKLGEVAHQIQIGRLLTMHAAWKLDQGSRARKEVSMAKVQVADALNLAADVAIQLNGARGYSKDTILEWIYRYARSAKLVDGASEVHKMVLARFMREEGRDFWKWGPDEERRKER